MKMNMLEKVKTTTTKIMTKIEMRWEMRDVASVFCV